MMRLSSLWLSALVLMTLPHVAFGQQIVQPEVIVVTGRLPGPPLWKVTSGDHVLWIFGVFSPIPAGMEWDSARVQKILAQADEYLTAPGWRVSPGALLTPLHPLKLVRGIKIKHRVKQDPEKKPLSQTLPPELYQRYFALKSRYFPKDSDIEKLRPLYALQSMRRNIMTELGLAYPTSIANEIEKLAKKNRKLQITQTFIETDLGLVDSDRAERLEAIINSVPRDKELLCFALEVQRDEEDLPAIKRRANAWAQGNINEFRNIVFTVGEDNSCVNMASSVSASLSKVDMDAEVNQQWLAAAELALSRSHTSLAVLEISQLLADKGLLAQLRDKGYAVREPQ